MSSNPTPEHILQVGMGFWASKTLLSAVELELFTALGDESMTGPDIGKRLGLHPRSLFDFLDALAHVAFFLDSRLCIYAACYLAAGSALAIRGADHFHGRFWLLARCPADVCRLGSL